ncbi:hypothetical protein Tco_0599993 [Tanacetum coccineum]|uniref:Uncharacterized protein n=1 Tax=Tanacetum coccineum TaxID=301880 RepID=A0ABQ4WAI2_9ASTR
MEDQPLSADASPTALSSGYIANSDPEEDEEDPEEDPADHPANGGDSDDNESSGDDDDDDDEMMITVNQGMSVEEIERVVAQRVLKSYRAIAIYESKTNMAPSQRSRLNDKEDKVSRDASTRESGKVTTMEARSNKTKGIRCLEHTLLGQ